MPKCPNGASPLSKDNGEKFTIGTITPWIARRLQLREQFRFEFIHPNTARVTGANKRVSKNRKVTFWSPKLNDLVKVIDLERRMKKLYASDNIGIRIWDKNEHIKVNGNKHLSTIRKPKKDRRDTDQ